MRKVFLFLTIIIISILSNFCSKDSNPVDPNGNGDKTSTSFLAFYKPGTEKILGESKLIAKLTVKNGEITYSKFVDAYPDGSGIVNNSDINNNIFALGLFWRDFNNQGMYMKLSETEYHNLPLVQPSEDSDYSYFQAATADVTDNGYILYLAGTNDKYYGDEAKDFIMRYNPSKDETDIAISPKHFVLEQPEKGNDTEAAMISGDIFASLNGKYVYGSLNAFGTEGGGIHWDYSILFRYDFDTKTYKRLGETTDANAAISAMTADRKYLLYTNSYTLKLLNLETGSVTYPTMNTVNVKKNSWNNYGACVGSTAGNIWYKDFANNKEILVCHPGGDPENAMFSEDGSKIFFTMKDYEKKYLYVTDGITENSKIDTLGEIPIEFYDMIMIK